jgi:hypothetical protein
MMTYYDVLETAVMVDKKRTLVGILWDNTSKGLSVVV